MAASQGPRTALGLIKHRCLLGCAPSNHDITVLFDEIEALNACIAKLKRA